MAKDVVIETVVTTATAMTLEAASCIGYYCFATTMAFREGSNRRVPNLKYTVEGRKEVAPSDEPPDCRIFTLSSSYNLFLISRRAPMEQRCSGRSVLRVKENTTTKACPPFLWPPTIYLPLNQSFVACIFAWFTRQLLRRGVQTFYRIVCVVLLGFAYLGCTNHGTQNRFAMVWSFSKNKANRNECVQLV